MDRSCGMDIGRMKARRTFRVEVSEGAFHGTLSVSALLEGMPSAGSCGIFTKVPWADHESWMSGGPHLDAGIPYANIVWETLGLRDRRTDPSGVAGWARTIRTHRALADRFGILLVIRHIRLIMSTIKRICRR